MNIYKTLGFLACAFFLLFAGAQQALAADWAELYTESSNQIFGVDFYNETTGAAVGVSGITPYILLFNESWNSQEVVYPGSDELYDIAYANETTLIAIGESGLVLRSEDGGATWEDLSFGISPDLNSVKTFSEDNIWIVGDSSALYQSTDQGVTWDLKVTTTGKDYENVYFVDDSTGYVVGEDALILKTTNGGSTWSDVSYTTGYTIYDIYFADDSTGFAATSMGLIYTENGGGDWFIEDSSTIYRAIDFKSDKYGVAVGKNAILTTSDYGATWNDYGAPDYTGIDYLIDVAYFDDHLVVAGYTSYLKALLLAADESEPSAVDNFAATRSGNNLLLSWDAATDDTGIDYYELDVDGSGYTTIGAETSYTLATSDGTHTLSLRAVDFVGNTGNVTTIEALLDTTGPSVSTINQIAATQFESIALTVDVEDALSSVTRCTLYLNSSSVGAMTNVGDGTFSKNYTFTVAGSYTAHATCTDEHGNFTTGSTSSITVGEGDESTEPTETTETTGSVIFDVADLDTNSLIKIICQGETDVNDICRAVYYYGDDGKRHAFPNEKVYFTWYENFDNIQLLTPEAMADITLGSNVTYHPGTKMVKFQSMRTVYAVDQGSVLRAIGSEEIATALYGDDWNQQIDDISDAFFGNYSFGDDIDDASDYNPEDAYNSVSSISDNL